MSEEHISPGPAGRPARGVRASDEDREQLIAELNEHTVAGRLDTDELEDRVTGRLHRDDHRASSTHCAATCPSRAGTWPSSTPSAAAS